MPTVIFEKVLEEAQLPQKAHDTDTGFDLVAAEGKRIRRGEWETIRLGWKVKLPKGYGFQIRSRSGLAVKHGVVVMNSPGTVDEEYVDEVKVILINLSREDFKVRPGNRIAQMVFEKRVDEDINFEEGMVGETSRKGGFGHTGDAEFLHIPVAMTRDDQIGLFDTE